METSKTMIYREGLSTDKQKARNTFFTSIGIGQVGLEFTQVCERADAPKFGGKFLPSPHPDVPHEEYVSRVFNSDKEALIWHARAHEEVHGSPPKLRSLTGRPEGHLCKDLLWYRLSTSPDWLCKPIYFGKTEGLEIGQADSCQVVWPYGGVHACPGMDLFLTTGQNILKDQYRIMSVGSVNRKFCVYTDRKAGEIGAVGSGYVEGLMAIIYLPGILSAHNPKSPDKPPILRRTQ